MRQVPAACWMSPASWSISASSSSAGKAAAAEPAAVGDAAIGVAGIGMPGLVLRVEMEGGAQDGVVHEVAADGGVVVLHGDAEGVELVGRADAGAQEDGGRVDGAGGEHQ